MNFERIVTTKALEFCYMKLYLEFEDSEEEEPGINIVQFKTIILDAVKILHGESGKASSRVDILKYDEQKKEAIIRMPRSEIVKVWSSITLFGQYGGQHCAFRTSQVSGHLMGLAANSRNYRHAPRKT